MTDPSTKSIPAHWPSEAALIADLNATFPGICAKPAADCGVPYFGHGAWLTGEACMPDGFEILSSLICNDPGIYDGNVHLGFIDWLSQRGWLIEEYDASMYFVTSQAQATDEAQQDAEFLDLQNQRNAAQLVLSSLEIRVALESARRAARLRDDIAETTFRQEAEKHRQIVETIYSQRPPFITLPRIDSQDQPDDSAPF